MQSNRLTRFPFKQDDFLHDDHQLESIDLRGNPLQEMPDFYDDILEIDPIRVKPWNQVKKLKDSIIQEGKRSRNKPRLPRNKQCSGCKKPPCWEDPIDLQCYSGEDMTRLSDGAYYRYNIIKKQPDISPLEGKTPWTPYDRYKMHGVEDKY